MLDFANHHAKKLSTALLTTAGALLLAGAARASDGPPAKTLLFLSRDAVVHEAGEPKAVVDRAAPAPCIVVGKDPAGGRKAFEDAKIEEAAARLKEYLKKITGVECPLADSAAKIPANATVVIFVGDPNGDPDRHFPKDRAVDGHGFVIHTVQNGAPKRLELYIVGKSGMATLYGVWFFLMNYADLRILMPLNEPAVGEVYPSKPRLEIPAELSILNPGPDYELRTWTGQGTFPLDAWLGDVATTTDRGSQRYEYHHNMYHIYDQRIYADEAKHPESFHPEYYPMISGKRFLPGPTSNSGWQPTFSAPGIEQPAFAYADRLFTQNPDMKSMSLSVNDGLGYSALDMALGKSNSSGQFSIAEVYAKYVNTVAAYLQKKWPGRFVSFIPYNYVATPPAEPLADNVMVMLFPEPKPAYEQWKKIAKNFSVYVWLYGATYSFPNHCAHALKDLLQWSRAHGARAFKAEGYIGWAEGGPRMWVLHNLLWNTDADVDALMRDYCLHAYGAESAPAMLEFFARAEQIYERRRTKELYNIAPWWQPGERQLEYVTPEDVQFMAAKLEEAAAAAKARISAAAQSGDANAQAEWERVAAGHILPEPHPDKVAQGPSIVPNGDFEAGVNMPLNWTSLSAATANCIKLVPEPRTGSTGKRSVQIAPLDDKGAVGIVSQLVRVDSGRTLTVSGWLKAEDKKHASGVYFGINWYDAQRRPVVLERGGTRNYDYITGGYNETEWKRFEIVFRPTAAKETYLSSDIPPNAAWFELRVFSLAYQPRAWCDDITAVQGAQTFRPSPLLAILQRIEYARERFNWARMYCDSLHALQSLEKARFAGEEDVTKAIEAARTFYQRDRSAPQYFQDHVAPYVPYTAYVADFKQEDGYYRWLSLENTMMGAFSRITDFKLRTQQPAEVAAFWAEAELRTPDLTPFAEYERVRALHPNARFKNLIPDGSFDTNVNANVAPKGGDSGVIVPKLKVYHNRMVDATVSLDPDVKHSGKYSVRVQGITDTSGVSFVENVKNRRIYRISFWYRSTGTEKNVRYQLGTHYPPRIRDSLPPTDEWKKVEVTCAINEDVTSPITGFTFFLMLSGGDSQNAKVWFDDVRFEMLAPENLEGD